MRHLPRTSAEDRWRLLRSDQNIRHSGKSPGSYNMSFGRRGSRHNEGGFHHKCEEMPGSGTLHSIDTHLIYFTAIRILIPPGRRPGRRTGQLPLAMRPFFLQLLRFLSVRTINIENANNTMCDSTPSKG